MIRFDVDFSVNNESFDLDFGEHTETMTTDYEQLVHRPKINTVELIGDKTGPELHLQDEMETISNLEIEALFS